MTASPNFETLRSTSHCALMTHVRRVSGRDGPCLLRTGVTHQRSVQELCDGDGGGQHPGHVADQDAADDLGEERGGGGKMELVNYN